MRELPQDRPYRFRPPVSRPWLEPALGWVNRSLFLRRQYRIREIDCRGIEALTAAMRAGHAVALAPNHADHADVHVLFEVCRRTGVAPRFMGAREIFEVSALASFALQSGGVFSVDRDGADIAAIKMAMSILEEGRHPLVIYPEGEIYHHHEWLDPLHDGLASILLRVARRLAAPRRALVFPVAFHFGQGADVAATFPARIAALERAISWEPKESLGVVERLLRLGGGLLSVKEAEYLGESSHGPLRERLADFREKLLAEVEGRRGRDAKATTPPERVRALRSRLRRALLATEPTPTTEGRHGLLDDLKRVHLAYQVYSYPGFYLEDNPSVGRIAETVLKLEEDLLGKARYPVARSVRVSFGEALDATALLAEGRIPEKHGEIELTALLEERLKALLAPPR